MSKISTKNILKKIFKTKPEKKVKKKVAVKKVSKAKKAVKEKIKKTKKVVTKKTTKVSKHQTGYCYLSYGHEYCATRGSR